MAGIILFRLRCGHRIWSPWLDCEDQAWKMALDSGLASEDVRGRVFPGPLMWIEKGYRRYAKRRIAPLTAELDGKPLSPRYVNPLPPR
jgi:hypothetical protein